MPLKKSKKRQRHSRETAGDEETTRAKRNSLKKEEVTREVMYGILSTTRGRNASWEMMMKVKMPALREQIEVAWHTFDRSIDVKDHRANVIVDAMEKATEQYETNFSSHADAIDRFMKIFQTRLADHEKRYRDNLELLVTNYMKNREVVNERQNDDDIAVRSIIFSTQRHFEERSGFDRSRLFAKVDLQKENNEISRRTAATMLESKLSNHWKELRSVLDDYENSTKERRRAYETIKTKDDREREIIKQQVSTTSTLAESIRKFKDKIENSAMATDRRISEITEEHKFFQDLYRTAKETFLSEQRRDRTRLIFLIKGYNGASARLKKLADKAEKILTLFHECNKYETQDEKILQPSLVEDYSYDQEEDDEIFRNDFQALETTFWRKVGTVRLITAELALERSRLLRESRYLRESLRECIADCNDFCR